MTNKANPIGILYCSTEGCNHILAVGGPAIDGMGLAHSFKRGTTVIKHEGFKKAVITAERDPVEHEDVNDWHAFLQQIVDKLEIEDQAKKSAKKKKEPSS
jgi:hypothetical protein